MKPPPFQYVAASTVHEALDALDGADDAAVLAGGQSLVPLMNLRLARPATLVDVNPVGELDFVRSDNGVVRLGALCRHRRLERDPEVGSRLPLLAEAAGLIGHPQIRNRGTLGGNLAHADPASEYAAALVALHARVVITGKEGEREVPCAEFFQGFMTTACTPCELITEVVVPAHAPTVAFREFAPRYGDFAVAGVAVVLEIVDDECVAARAGGCGLAAVPVDLSAAFEGLLGARRLDDGLLRDLAGRVTEGFEAVGDVHASREDRQELAQLLAVDAVRAAWTGAGGEEQR